MFPFLQSRRWSSIVLKFLVCAAAAPPLAAQLDGKPRVQSLLQVKAPEPVVVTAAGPAPAPTAPMPEVPVPPVPIGPSNGLPQPASPPASVREHNGGGPVTAVGAFTVFRNEVVRPTSANVAFPVNPSACNLRDASFYAGNNYGALSIDSGATWTHVDPAMFPALDGGVGTQHRAYHVASHDIVVWLIQHRYSVGTGKGSYRIAVANGRDDLVNAGTASTWTLYRFDPVNDFGFAAGHWLHYPDVACDKNYLYVTANVVDAVNTVVDAVIWRIDLNDLRAGNNLGWSHHKASAIGGGFSLRLAVGGNRDRVHFADLVNTTTIRIWRWESNVVALVDRTIAAWSNAQASCPGPDSREWMGRAVGRIRGGCGSPSGELVFFWTSSSRAGRPMPYTRVARFTESFGALIAEHDVWGPNTCFGYATAEASSQSDLGVVLAVGSATRHPHMAAFLIDAYQPWNSGSLAIHLFQSGNQGPPSDNWGEYLGVQRSWHDGRTFLGAAYEFGGTPSEPRPRYVWFGRDDYTPAWTTLDVASTPISVVPITVNVTDRNGQRDGTTPFSRSYTPNQGYELTAPSTQTVGTDKYVFHRWTVGTKPQPIGEAKLVVGNMGTGASAAQAEYRIQRTLAIDSVIASSVNITASPADLNNRTGGTTSFTLLYKNGEPVTLTAPATSGVARFRRWREGSTLHPVSQLSVVIVADADKRVSAEYYVPVGGSATEYGTGCAGSNGVDRVFASGGVPQIGGNVTINLDGGPINSSTIFALGFSKTSWLGVPLPLVVPDAPGCSIYTSMDLSLVRATNGLGRVSVLLSIPFDPTIVGGHAYFQAWSLDLGANTLGMTFSNGLDLVVGER